VRIRPDYAESDGVSENRWGGVVRPKRNVFYFET